MWADTLIARHLFLTAVQILSTPFIDVDIESQRSLLSVTQVNKQNLSSTSGGLLLCGKTKESPHCCLAFIGCHHFHGGAGKAESFPTLDFFLF